METINERLARFVEHIGGSQPNGKGVPEVARKAGLDPNTLRIALRPAASKPSYDTITAILKGYPVLSAEWLLLGTGEMLKWGGKPAELVTPHIAPAEEPRVSYASVMAEPPIVAELRAELADCQKQYRADLKQARIEAREDLTASSNTWQYTVNRMKDTIDQQLAQIAALQAENHELKLRAGLRFPTAAEAKLMEQQGPPPAKRVKGLKNYEEDLPQGAEMTLVRGESGFPRLPEFDAESPLRIAA
jgi:hypothetical protein